MLLSLEALSSSRILNNTRVLSDLDLGAHGEGEELLILCKCLSNFQRVRAQADGKPTDFPGGDDFLFTEPILGNFSPAGVALMKYAQYNH